MSYKEDFDQNKERIEAVKKQETKLPDRPIDLKAAQAETLVIEANKDKEALEGAGLDWTMVSELGPLAGALRHCQAEWMSQYRAQQEVQKNWKEESPLAYELRNEMLHHLSFGYRNDDDITKKVMRIREGSGHADMVQDLLELAVLAEKYPEPLTKIQYDTSLNQKAKATSHDIGELLAHYNGAKDDSSEIKLLRDKAFTLVDDRMRKIREVGQYVFWRDPERKAKYVDDYK